MSERASVEPCHRTGTLGAELAGSYVALGVMSSSLTRLASTLAAILLGSCLAACSHTRSTEIDLTEPLASDVVEPDRAIDAHAQVPDFRITTTTGEALDSRDLIGKRSFMFVFFATWCEVCRLKLPMVRAALARQSAAIEVYGVVMDDASTWYRVPDYVDKYNIDYRLVRAERFPKFAVAYSPSGRVPAVTIVGKDGYLVDYQHGYSVRHFERLLQALALAEHERQ